MLPAGVSVPAYKRSELSPGIVHLGVGAFHRAHQAWYTDQVLNECAGGWAIVGCSLQSPQVRDQMMQQDCLYSIAEVGGESPRCRIVGAVTSVIFGPENPQVLVDILAQESIKIVSLTITEKGYCYDPASGGLNIEHPGIQHDLNSLSTPKTAPGYLLAGMMQRMVEGRPGFSVLSCDNLPDNGNILSKVILQMAARVDQSLPQWIRENVSFPCTMVDRIVPATADSDKAKREELLGFRDEAAVVAEPFSQWVVEDDFVRGRPAWETVGVTMVADVRAYEAMKLRLLNATHSMLAYAGYLGGYENICDTMGNTNLVSLVKRFMDEEVMPTLKIPEGFDVIFYMQQLRSRFANKALKHRTWQVAMDGSQKLPQRQIAIIRDQMAQNRQIEISCFGLAAWMRYVRGVDEQGEPIDVQDPLAEELKQKWVASDGNTKDLVDSILNIEGIFGRDFPKSNVITQTISKWLDNICRLGILSAIDTLSLR